MSTTAINPYPGLRPFEFSDSDLFFGRDGQCDRLRRKLQDNRFVAVVGTSSSGKSSLVRAGLLPTLYGGLMLGGGSNWRVAILRPGGSPIRNLAQALSETDAPGLRPSDADIQIALAEATLRRSSLGLIELVRQSNLPLGENVLVVVDQFEELFRFQRHEDADEAAAFVRLLLEGTRHVEVPIYVVLTMRSDYIGDCAQFWALPEALNAGLYLVPRLTREECREAITGPVAVAGGRITPPLVNRLLNDMGDNPDQLPILQHAMMRIWDCWSESRAGEEPVDIAHYESIGTMSEALSRHAEEAFNELPDDRSRQLAEKLFRTLTETVADNREVRRPTDLKEICTIAEATPDEMRAVIDVFRRPGRSFLMPPAAVRLMAETIIDISHESLIRNWQRLKRWVEEEANAARIYRRLAENALLFKNTGVLSDPWLTEALDWRNLQRPNRAWARRYFSRSAALFPLTGDRVDIEPFEVAMGFLEASERARETSKAEAESNRYRMLRRTRVVTSVLAVLMMLSVSLFIYSDHQRRDAEAQRRIADIERMEALRLKEEVENQKNLVEQIIEEAVERARMEAAKARDASRTTRR